MKRLLPFCLALLAFVSVGCQPDDSNDVSLMANPLVGYSWRLLTEDEQQNYTLIVEQVLTFETETRGTLFRGWQAVGLTSWTDTTVDIYYEFNSSSNTGKVNTVDPYWIKEKKMVYNPSDETLTVDGDVFEKEN